MADTLSTRLRALHERVVDPATGRPYTQRAVSAALSEVGVSLSPAYFNQLLNGSRGQRPSFEVVQGLANFYGVPVAYFDLTDSQTHRTVLDEIDLLYLARDERFKTFMMRARHGSGGEEKLARAITAALVEAEEALREPGAEE